jgi:hypothetical protein
MTDRSTTEVQGVQAVEGDGPRSPAVHEATLHEHRAEQALPGAQLRSVVDAAEVLHHDRQFRDEARADHGHRTGRRDRRLVSAVEEDQGAVGDAVEHEVDRTVGEEDVRLVDDQAAVDVEVFEGRR